MRHRHETWKHGEMETWRHGEMNKKTWTWRHGHGVIDMETKSNGI